MIATLFAEGERISLTTLARQQGVNVSTVWRWCRRGCRGHRVHDSSGVPALVSEYQWRATEGNRTFEATRTRH
jgi:hypothetical protein